MLRVRIIIKVAYQILCLKIVHRRSMLFCALDKIFLRSHERVEIPEVLCVAPVHAGIRREEENVLGAVKVNGI